MCDGNSCAVSFRVICYVVIIKQIGAIFPLAIFKTFVGHCVLLTYTKL